MAASPRGARRSGRDARLGVPFRRSAVAWAILSVLLGVMLIVLALPLFDQGFDTDCDNEAGECVRARQKAAAVLLATAALAAGFASLLNAASLARSSSRRWRYVAMGLTCLLAAVLIAVAPASHLDNQHTGWLSE